MKEFENYKGLSREFGVTIPFIKKIFQEEGIISGKEPTDKAVAMNIFQEKEVNGRFSQGLVTMYLWDSGMVKDLLEKHGVSNYKNSKELFIDSKYKAADRVSEAGSIFNELFVEKRSNCPDDIACTCAYFMFESTSLMQLLYLSKGDGRVEKVREWINKPLTHIKQHRKMVRLNKEDREQYDLALAKLESVISWSKTSR